MDLVFAGHPDRGAVSTVVGPRSESVLLQTSREFSAIGVHFRPGGGYAVFGPAIGELLNNSAELELLWGREAHRTTDRLWQSCTAEEQFRLLENLLLAKLTGVNPHRAAITRAIGLIESASGHCQVAAIASTLGFSTRRFLTEFRAQVGLPPKLFSRIMRFTSALARIDTTGDVDWCDVALSTGYFDQAHFNHDFRGFAGVNPSEYMRQRTSRTHVAVTT
jgi:AraC-like DNA-binding protein